MLVAAGYSKTPLVRKLGIKPGFAIHLIQTPENYLEHTLGPLPDDVVQHPALIPELDFIHVFTKQRIIVEAHFDDWKAHLSKTGMLWISWPKKASKVPTDLSSNIVREIGLAHGLVDVKVCAVDAVWSGLKFMYRVKDR